MENKEAYKTHFENLEEMSKSVGKELGISNWVEISQEKINLFAKITEDEQWIHIDAEKSAKESPYKTTIAHGFMVLSLACLLYTSPSPRDVEESRMPSSA